MHTFSFNIMRTARLSWFVACGQYSRDSIYKPFSPFADEVNLSSTFLMVSPWGRISYGKQPNVCTGDSNAVFYRCTLSK